MNRSVADAIIGEWIDENSPYGLEKLVQKSKVSSSTIQNVRLGYVPKKSTRLKICRAMNIPEAKLFPDVEDGKEEAS